MRAVDPRLLQHAQAARGYLVVAVLFGLAATGLILAQAGSHHQLRHAGGPYQRMWENDYEPAC